MYTHFFSDIISHYSHKLVKYMDLKEMVDFLDMLKINPCPDNLVRRDHVQNNYLTLTTKSRFYPGQIVMDKHGHTIRLISFIPKGFTHWSKARIAYYHNRQSPSIVCEHNTWSFMGVGLHAPRTGRIMENDIREKPHTGAM